MALVSRAVSKALVSMPVSTETQRHNMTTEQTKRLSHSRQIIVNSIRELTGLGHSLTRDNLQAATGLTMHIIDDHVSRMIDEDGTLRRVRPGVYELVMGVGKMPSVHFSDLDDGALIIEVEGCGKLVLDDHRVMRKIAERLSGSYAHVAMLELKYQFGVVSQDLMLELIATKRELSQRLREAEEQCAQLRQQLTAQAGQAPEHQPQQCRSSATATGLLGNHAGNRLPW